MLQLNNFEIFSSFRFFFFKKLLNYLGIALYDYISIISLQLFIIQNKIRLYLYILQNSERQGLSFIRKIKEISGKSYLEKDSFDIEEESSKFSLKNLPNRAEQLRVHNNFQSSRKISKYKLETSVFIAFLDGTLPLWKIHKLLSRLKGFKLSFEGKVCSKLLWDASNVSNTPLTARVLQAFNSYLVAQHAKAALNLTFY